MGATGIDHDRVVAAIGAAELRTSGEIRVFVSREAVDDPVAAATRQFERLGMTQTAARNGVLIFIAPASRNFAAIGDAGIHEKCGDRFWCELAAAMTTEFQRGNFTAGLELGIARYFTYVVTKTVKDDRILPVEQLLGPG